MLEFYQKKSWRKVVQSPVVIGFLGVLCVLLSYAVYDRYVIARDMEQRRLEEERVLSELEQQKEQLQKKVEYLSNERGIEAEMRRNFDIALPGEQVVIIMDKEQPPQPEPLPPMPNTTSTRPWYKFW
jgi:cell division protein FtsB